MVTTTEIAPEIYRLAVFVPEINLEFSHFLVRDEEPLLFHAGLRSMFPLLREAVSRLIDVSKLRHIGFSHFESDECGGLNHWLELAPAAQPVCGLVGAMVSVNDFSIRPARVLTRDDVLPTGRYRFRFLPTPHVPHGWDAGVLFEESGTHAFLLRPVSSMGPSRTGHGERHSGTMPRCAAGSRSGSVCELRAVYASHRARARKFSGTGTEDARRHAWLELLRQWSASIARSGCRHARRARAQSTGWTNNPFRHDQNIEQ